MPGNETHGYDMTIQFTEDAVKNLVANIFDSENYFEDVIFKGLNDIIPGFPRISYELFNAHVSYDRPTDDDIELPADAANVIDINFYFGDNGNLGKLRIVTSVNVEDDILPQVEIAETSGIAIDFEKNTYYASAEIGGENVGGSLKSKIEEIGILPLFPIPKFPTTDNPTLVKKIDVKIIDDVSEDNRNALAFLLTYGGGTDGNKDNFTQRLSRLDEGEVGALSYSFNWLCRILRPRLVDAFSRLGTGVPRFSATCSLDRPFSMDDDVDLTSFELTLVDNAINITATLKKSKFCYSASATLSGRIEMVVGDDEVEVDGVVEVRKGVLKIIPTIDDPEVDIDVPLLCWVGGFVLGGFVLGIIGNVAIPLVLYTLSEGVGGAVENVAGDVIETVDNQREFKQQLHGFNLVLQDAYIDDIGMIFKTQVKDMIPIKAEGVITVHNGQRFDLDNGVVGDSALSGADLVFDEDDTNRKIRSLCNIQISKTNSTCLSDFTRYKMYELSYSNSDISFTDFATVSSQINSSDIQYTPTAKVFAVQTNENRYSLIQVIRIDDDLIEIKYKTYEKNMPRLDILGDFNYGVIDGLMDHQVWTMNEIQTTRNLRTITNNSSPSTRNQNRSEPSSDAKISIPANIAKYEVPMFAKRTIGTFRAKTQNITKPLSYKWFVNRNPLVDTEGEVKVDGGRLLENSRGEIAVSGLVLKYTINKDSITFEPKSNKEASFELGATVVDDNDLTLSSYRCVEVKGEKPRYRRVVPDLKGYLEEFAKTFGVLEVLTIPEVPELPDLGIDPPRSDNIIS